MCVTLTADNLSQLVVVRAGIMATNFRVEVIGTDSRTEQNTTLDKNTVLENLPQVLKEKFELETIGQGTKLPDLCELLLCFCMAENWFCSPFLLNRLLRSPCYSEGKSLELGCFHSFELVWELEHD